MGMAYLGSAKRNSREGNIQHWLLTEPIHMLDTNTQNRLQSVHSFLIGLSVTTHGFGLRCEVVQNLGIKSGYRHGREKLEEAFY